MKKLFFLAIALLCAIAGNSQVVTEVISATLQKGDSTKVYYGTDALKTAMNNADNGSIITLSSGIFAVPANITKSVKIYGAGFEEDTINGIARTTINGYIYMNGVDGVHVDNFYMEGVWLTGELVISNAASDELIEGIKIVKCRTAAIRMNENSSGTILRQCFLEGNIYGNNTLATGFMVENCYVTGEINGFNTESAIVVDHCILTAGTTSYATYYHGPYFYKNTIINRWLATGAVAVNCVANSGHLSNNGANTVYNCYTNYTLKTLFADGQDNLNYTLAGTEIPRAWVIADPETYKGDDGKPVGVAGGTYPWNKIPSTPRIISSTIDSKTTAGKLHVNIKAEARPVVE